MPHHWRATHDELISAAVPITRRGSPLPRAAAPRRSARRASEQHRERNQVRMKPSISLSAQARVFSIGSPCLNRTTILVWIAWV